MTEAVKISWADNIFTSFTTAGFDTPDYMLLAIGQFGACNSKVKQQTKIQRSVLVWTKLL